MQSIHLPSTAGTEVTVGRTTTITTFDVLQTGVSVLFSNTSATADLTEAEVQIIDTFF
jgi:hypothetical protein